MNIIETNLSFGSMSVRSKTTRIILHHAAAKSCGASTIHQWHLNNGWSGIGYHFVVRKNGTIERGRPENTVGAHASGSNYDSIGICFEGDFMSETMTDTQKNVGKELVSYLKNKYGISKVQKHSDVCSTDCPGTNLPFVEIAGATGNMTAPSTSSGASTNWSGVVNTPSGVNVRSGAGTSYSIITAIPNGTSVTITKESGGWGYASNYGGWVSLQYIRKGTGGSSTGSSGFNKSDWVRRLQKECNAQGFSNQTVDGKEGPNTLAGCPLVKQGASGGITKLIQEYLIAHGYSCGAAGADGIFGSGTAAAVRAWQSDHGLTADADVGPKTWASFLGL